MDKASQLIDLHARHVSLEKRIRAIMRKTTTRTGLHVLLKNLLDYQAVRTALTNTEGWRQDVEELESVLVFLEQSKDERHVNVAIDKKYLIRYTWYHNDGSRFHVNSKGSLVALKPCDDPDCDFGEVRWGKNMWQTCERCKGKEYIIDTDFTFADYRLSEREVWQEITNEHIECLLFLHAGARDDYE